MKLVPIAAWALSLAAAQAWGQSAVNRPDPGNPKAVVASTAYRSAFAGYRKHGEENVESWKEVNDNVGRIGGWRVYLKEAHTADPPTPGAAAPAKPPSPSPVIDKSAPADHGGH